MNEKVAELDIHSEKKIRRTKRIHLTLDHRIIDYMKSRDYSISNKINTMLLAQFNDKLSA